MVLRDLGGGNEWEVVESYSDGASIDEISRTATTITARSTGPSGSYLELSVHRLDGTSISAGGCGGAAVGASGEAVDEGPVGCDLVDEPIPFGDEPLTVRLSIVTAEGEALTLEEHLVPPASEGSVDDHDDLVLDRHLDRGWPVLDRRPDHRRTRRRRQGRRRAGDARP